MKKILGKTYSWFNERVNLDNMVYFFTKKVVPVHKHSIWYYFGGVTLFFFIIQVITGILLLFYYKASADQAFESIHYIMTKVEFGWLIRSIHSWAANLFILSAFVHMFSVLFEKSYRKPRELTWVTGVFMFFLALAFGFSGYLLPWNELAFFATKVGTDIAGAVPFIGEPIKIFLRGGDEVSGATLSRLFGFHVALLPPVFTVLLIVHLVFVQVQGMSEPQELKNRKAIPFFPNFVLRDLLLWLIMLNILAVLAVFFPSELGHKADPFASAPEGIKPEWYYLSMYQSLKYFPAHFFFLEGETVGVLLFSIAGIMWLLIPFWDKKTSRGEKNIIINYIGLFAIIFIIVLTILGWLS
jgi:cytochrome b6